MRTTAANRRPKPKQPWLAPKNSTPKTRGLVCRRFPNLRNDRPAAAEKLLKEGLRLDPKNPGAYFDLGNAQIKQGNLGAALKSFEKASGLRQNFWEAVNNQGIVLFEEDRRDDAINRWRQAVEMSDGEAEPMLALAAALYANGDDSADTLGLAVQALIKQPDYVLAAFQEDQL